MESGNENVLLYGRLLLRHRGPFVMIDADGAVLL